jgi:hypothetical protein
LRDGDGGGGEVARGGGAQAQVDFVFFAHIILVWLLVKGKIQRGLCDGKMVGVASCVKTPKQNPG